MKNMLSVITMVFVLGLSSLAWATIYDFEDTINYGNEIAYYNFTANGSTDVRIWTDSWHQNLDGINLDPIMYIWTNSGNFVRMNDDNETLETLDSAVLLPNLAAGSYICTIGSYNNYAKGSTLAEGFLYDGTPPIPIGEFSDQIVFNPNDTGYYHINFEGVNSVAPVPEPGTMLLLGFGMFGLAIYGKRRCSFKEA